MEELITIMHKRVFARSGAISLLTITLLHKKLNSGIIRRGIINIIAIFFSGKVNSLFGVCEAIVPLIYGPMYSYIYRTTLETMPGAFFLIGGALTAPAAAIFW